MIIFISVSGESANLLKGLEYAKENSICTASLTGSDSMNSLRNNSKYSLWVNSKAYNIVESIHTIWITLIIDLFVGTPEYSVNKKKSILFIIKRLINKLILLFVKKLISSKLLENKANHDYGLKLDAF